MLWQHIMSMELYPFYYYFMITKKPNLINVKNKLAYLNQYSPRKYIRIHGTTISIPYKMGEI